MAAVCIIIRPFVLKQKDQKFKADIIGPNAHSGRFPAMSARLAHPTRSVLGVPNLSDRSSHVMPTLTGAAAGIYGCGIHGLIHLNIKTRHCISGWGGVVPSGLGLAHCLWDADKGGPVEVVLQIATWGTEKVIQNTVIVFFLFYSTISDSKRQQTTTALFL